MSRTCPAFRELPHGRCGNGRLLLAANGPRATYAIGRTKHLCRAMIGRFHLVAGSYSRRIKWTDVVTRQLGRQPLDMSLL